MLAASAGGDIGLAIILACFLSIIPVIGPIIAVILIAAVVGDTCVGNMKNHSSINKKDNMTYVVQLHEMNPNIDRVLQHPEAEIRITR
ncbi:MAG: hypothetical protein CO029_00385 [Candidatus Magasanikbacteria bacterium CG_4_9_14_0_2_um_filter_41_10]|uniref:Uncharacterized protein n=1 Tax=Candidatus Magasanikbacteria bacterium CG_4_10_14_0_2_um_filter_41_31 TaxID=1974639 RepID=A0A2M7V3A1_9BACT|nr:MAG: hypothetical protein AUJ37_04830 [Candidatus Magasanikbacteria bacterium CG1_02_41_34]PIZ92960.1 MAG: hypothetical protein COX83_03115 [Candidatus Magasanikbacteria bacterium CG_4_10_14_0_2_um_filter_41_31]PJC53896.1 MAG: hypothetical protein CO029_00385 [Candidatus Magasanikbacteria bacterium CG_4_9_14_0_2_um_filter_41_10]